MVCVCVRARVRALLQVLRQVRHQAHQQALRGDGVGGCAQGRHQGVRGVPARGHEPGHRHALHGPRSLRQDHIMEGRGCQALPRHLGDGAAARAVHVQRGGGAQLHLHLKATLTSLVAASSNGSSCVRVH